MITIIDYGLGNIKAISNIYKSLHIPVIIARDAANLRRATKLILPGVGAFDHAMQQLCKSGMMAAIESQVMEEKIPVLGICVGMQMLARDSDEGSLPGLGWIDASVKRLGEQPATENLAIPHMGWNKISPAGSPPLFDRISTDDGFYFLHSYYFHAHKNEDILATASYGSSFCCAVMHENIYGVQFHPEKSHSNGITLLKNFYEL